MKLLCCLFFLLSTTELIFADSFMEGWKKLETKGGFTIYSRKEKNTDLVGIKVEGVIDAPVESVLANLRSVEGSEEWTPALRKKTTIKNISDLEAITYTLNNMPWPVWDREMILHNILKIDKKKKLLFVMSKSVDEQFPSFKRAEGTVMAKLHYSNMGFRPVGPNKSYVELTAFVDAKGDIPIWMVNFFQRKWPVKFLRAIERRANRHKPKLLPGIQKMLDELRAIL